MLQERHSMRKGQEEMVGFALVLVVLAVIGTVLLGFFARTPSSSFETSNAEVRTFLDSLVASTSSCSFGSSSLHVPLGDVIVQCVIRPERKCSGGVDVCASLNTSMHELLRLHYPLVEGGTLTGYAFTIQQTNASAMYRIENGICAERKAGDEVLLPGERPIVVTFTRCLRA